MNPRSLSTDPSFPLLSIVIPVYNGGQAFVDCLNAINQSEFRDWELIVVDDGSTDSSAIVAQQFGANLLHTNGRLGPGAARNLGAAIAQGEFLCFVDADCEVHSDTLAQLAQVLQSQSHISAVFGSYDDAPKAKNFVAQFKNLMHHYVHQTGYEEATTFWAGCGAVRRSLFLKLGGFDVRRYPRPSIEDIHLGYRIQQAGGKIQLAKQVQVKHHKAWRLGSLIKVDIFDRGIPWTQLLLEYPNGFVNDLNLKGSNRMSVVAVYSLLVLLPLTVYVPHMGWLMGLLAAILLWLNRDVYQFFQQKRGLVFASRAVFMHWLYYFYSGIAFGLGTIMHSQKQWQPVGMRRFRFRRTLKRLVGVSDA
ncbi:glycosyltransferase family 2 protein [Leptolyngbya sp. FACHB-321]|uniref:glycosyltransferase family 2 protein n=1 Tax=Leptolyngbya sp. FACHB-321 TaxID=2692807 RepID=UPI0016886605|nr:glycosyltransferase family 2 protein [Leptolyngbya sp. FACHB-321]MBD2036606.1 glycosyltransferase family 2 protein [Leptolyngbya sp. FACHB-321]